MVTKTRLKIFHIDLCLSQTSDSEGEKGMIVKMEKKRKKGFNIRIFGIIICIILIIASLCIIFRPDKIITTYGLEVFQPKIGKDEEITKDQAREIAVKQFEKMGENVDKNKLEVLDLQRKDGQYYYISAQRNSLEIRVKGGEITRINAVPVKE